MGVQKQSNITNVPPSFYNRYRRDQQDWLESKANDDNVEDGLWRIDNTLYDLSDFIQRHPGGPDWLKMTKGHDITEAFYSHHLNDAQLEPYLKKYRVRETTKPRNVKLTFEKNGFYMTLRKRVAEKLPEIKKRTTVYSKFYIDGLFVVSLLTAILAQRFQSIPIALFCGVVFTWCGISAHNFLHQRDNHRMKYFNLMFMSFRDWRVSHVLSHHAYPNSLLDYEVSVLEPFLFWIPNPAKVDLTPLRYASIIYSPLFYSLVFLVQFAKKTYLLTRGYTKMYLDEFVPFTFPVIMWMFGGDNSFASAVKMFLIIVLFGSLVFGLVGFNAGHHSPEVVHDGDALRKDLDWGLYSIDTTVDREDLRGSKFLALANFGDHALHHLFPTLDHGILPELYGILFETLMEYDAECRVYPWFKIIQGQFQQLVRDEPMKLDPHERYLLKNRGQTVGNPKSE